MSWRTDASATDSSIPDSSAAAAPASGAPNPPPQPLAAELANVPAAVEALQRAGVIAIPTDTLYGEHLCVWQPSAGAVAAPCNESSTEFAACFLPPV